MMENKCKYMRIDNYDVEDSVKRIAQFVKNVDVLSTCAIKGTNCGISGDSGTIGILIFYKEKR